MRWPMLGQMTGNRPGVHHLELNPIATSEVEDAFRAAETACRIATQRIPQEVEVSQALLVYPEGEADAVTITERDLEELQPGKFLGNHIVDFYVRYLRSRLPPEHGKLFYFFNSFFFTKLLQSSAPTRIDPFKLDYEQIRKWTEEVNLFEKDYVLIPIVDRSHWSLVILCNLSSLTRPPDEMTRFPCIVHLDPFEGQHESFEGLMKSYVLEAWMDRLQPSIDRVQLRHQLQALYWMKYIQAKVPQQDNSHDCGLYVLQYIESILVESTSPGFSFALSERGTRLAHPHFEAEVLSKRRRIQNLILELSGVFQERVRKRKAMMHLIQELMQTSQKLQAYLKDEGHSEACIKDVLSTSPTIFSGQGCEINHASIHEDSMDVQRHRSSKISSGNNEPLSGPQIEPVECECESRSEGLSPKQEHVEREVHTVGPTDCNDSNFETKHVPTHQDAIGFQHQQPSGLLRLDYQPLDGLELGHVEFQRVSKSFSGKHQHPKLEEVPCMDLSKAVKGKNKRGRNMTEEETSVLLLCKVEGGRFCKGSGGGTHWNLISEEIGKKLGSLSPSADQCRLRYDTLLKAYKTYKKYCTKTNKTFPEITEDERLDLKLATILSEEWYTTIGMICDEAKSRKRVRISPGVCNDLSERSLEDGAVVMESPCETVEVALRNVLAEASVFSSLNEDLQSTLLNLVQECSPEFCWYTLLNGIPFDLKRACRRLAILQDRAPGEIANYVFKLWELKLLRVLDPGFQERKDLAHIDLWNDDSWFIDSGLCEKISQEVLCKNPHLKTYWTSFPIELASLQHIRVLRLHDCWELEHLDLRQFPSLWSLSIRRCPKFNLVTGWEVATGLGELAISGCNAYCDFPEVQYLFSLKEFDIRGREFNKSAIPWQLSQLRQCAELRRLVVSHDASLSEVADFEALKELKFLESLSLRWCSFSSIRGLSGLQALTTLKLQVCENLRRVPELGCLKGLTALDMSSSGVEDVVGVEELHLLTSLDLSFCTSLKCLPFLGHLEALVKLNLRYTRVEEIPGREGLISLKILS